ncbi:unnamed protein product [Mesocestoides corti]|uniref:Anaphase-promoting complex subunit 4 WD40 domain-containing protein n=1 Tax=Mesocestoides corti TaxID=53468 RepID=A0A0R3UJC0_MESCO|nr:unnamed protein product [Mesocestoides corti]
MGLSVPLAVDAILPLPGGLPCRSVVANGDSLVTGNDGGYINFISVASGSFELTSCLAKVEAADSKRHCVVAAGDSNGKVHIFDLKSGSTLVTYEVGHEESPKPTIVWTLAFVGSALFSGDSRGTVSVWDVEVGGIVSSFRSHAADVLALAVSMDNQSVFAAGADPVIHRFDLCQTENIAQWQPSGVIRGSQRDIRGLVFVQRGEAGDLRSFSGDMDHLLAVGNEARLQILPCPRSDFGDKPPVSRRGQKGFVLKVPPPICLPFWPLTVTPTLPLAVHFAQETFKSTDSTPARLCLMQHADYVSLYRLPPRPKRIFEVKKTPRYFLKLAHIQPKLGNHIRTCCISPCGKFIAYSDEIRSRVLKVEHPVSVRLFLPTYLILSSKLYKFKYKYIQKSWKFNPNEPAPLTTLSRLAWVKAGRRGIQSRTSSTSSDADNTDSEDGHSLFLSLDQSSADLFVTNEVNSFDEQLLPRKRKAATAIGDHQTTDDQAVESSNIPSSCLMAFTPNSSCLVSVDEATMQITCRRLDSGVEMWRFTPGKENFKDECITLLTMACRDGRVLVHAFNDNSSKGQRHLFTCPKVADPVRPRHHPRPVSIALRVEEGDETVTACVTVLYTTGQIIEWAIPLQVVKPDADAEVVMVGSPQTDSWLDEFWQRHSTSWRKCMPRFHSMDYLPGGHVIILASRGFCLALDRREQIRDNDIQVAFLDRNWKGPDGCLNVFYRTKTMLQCTVLADRIAALRMDAKPAIANLPAPLLRKRFGT